MIGEKIKDGRAGTSGGTTGLAGTDLRVRSTLTRLAHAATTNKPTGLTYSFIVDQVRHEVEIESVSEFSFRL